MPSLVRLARLGITAGLLLHLSLLSAAAEWMLSTGDRIKADPVEAYGPFALFEKSKGQTQRVRFQALTQEDCLRFLREAPALPAQAADWAQAQGAISREIFGNACVVRNRKLEPIDLKGRPEPELFVLLFASHNDGDSWRMLVNFQPTYRRLKAAYRDRTETLYFGIRNDASQHRDIAEKNGGGMPWLVSNFSAQTLMSSIARLRPREGILMLAVTRNGTVLVASPGDSLSSIRSFIDDLAELLRQTDPETPSSWKDRLHYQNAVRPVLHVKESVPPLLVANPLRPEGLRQREVKRVIATLQVDAKGAVTAVAMDPTTQAPAAMLEPLAKALQKGLLFSPAFDQGNAVPGSHTFVLKVPPAPSPQEAANLFWVKNPRIIEVPISSWFVLKPVSVPEQLFSTVARVDESGTVMMTAFEASSGKVSRASQMNSFNTDFFTKDGAASVAPKEGEHQVVDGLDLVWERMEAVDGFVNLQPGPRNIDYCIGYAWTEIETPKALDAWLGIGSDDGLKIWLNGDLVHDRWTRRISQVDDDIVPLKLREGKNRLLIKIQNATGDWSFTYRMRVRE